jgi:hypothetical protein
MNNKNYFYLVLGLRLIVLVLLIIFFISFNTSPRNNCGDCRFEIEDNVYVDSDRFMRFYFDKCIYPYKQTQSSFNVSILTKLNGTGSLED